MKHSSQKKTSELRKSEKRLPLSRQRSQALPLKRKPLRELTLNLKLESTQPRLLTNQPMPSSLSMSKRSLQSPSRLKDIKSKLQSLMVSKSPKLLKIFRAQSLKSRPVLILFNISVSMLVILKSTMTQRTSHVTTSVKTNGSAM